MQLRNRKLRKTTIINLKNFIAYCKVRINSIPKKQQSLMRMYVDYAFRVLQHKPISNTQVNNLLVYMRIKMQERKICPFTHNHCISDFPNSINTSECSKEGACILLL